MKKGSDMSELSMHELEAQIGEVLPEREALSVFVGSFNHHTTINHNTTHTTTARADSSDSVYGSPTGSPTHRSSTRAEGWVAAGGSFLSDANAGEVEIHGYMPPAA